MNANEKKNCKYLTPFVKFYVLINQSDYRLFGFIEYLN